MSRWIRRGITCAIFIGSLALAAGGPASVESPPSGTSPSVFADAYRGCLGGLRSFIARGGLGEPERFSRDFNPGKHQGTVGEEEFLKATFQFDDAELAQFCAQF